MQPVILESKKMIPDDCRKITGAGSRVTGNTTEPAGRQGNGKPDVTSTVRNTTGNVTNAGNSSDVSNTKSKKAIQRTALSQRASNFRQLMKASVIGFNRRLAMLENTGLDLKDSFKHLQKRQDDLSHQLRNLTQMLAAPSKDKLISDLTWKYTAVDDKLTALQVQLEILIDGFAALAEEVSELKKRKAFRTNSDQPDSSKIATSSPQHQKALSKASSKLKPASHGGYNKSVSFVSTKPSVKVPSVGATEHRKGKHFRFPKKQTNDVDLMPSVQAEVTTTASPVQSTSKTQASRKLGAKNKPLPGKGRAVGKEVPRTENPVLTLDLVLSTLHANVTGFTIAPSTLSTQLTPTAVLKQTEKTYPLASKGKVKAGDLGTVNHTEGPARGKGVTKPSSKTRTESTGKTKPSRRLPGQSQGKVKPGRKITAHPKGETKRGNTAATQHPRTSASTSNNDASEKYKIKDPSAGSSMHRKRKEFLRSDVSTLSPVIKQPKLASQRPLPTEMAAKKISAEGRAQLKDATEIPLRRSESQPVAGPQEKICVNENPTRNKTTGTRKRKVKKASALDILQLLKGGYGRYTGRKVKNVPLYITLGRLAIPIKIIPD